MESNDMKKQYPGVDIIKFICSILVIAIHTQPFVNSVWLDRGIGIITRLAVPFFFTSTGFLLFDESLSGKRIAKYIKRIIILYMIWSVLYLPFNIPISNPIKRFFLDGVNGHLWYLPALVFSVVFIFLLSKYVPIKGVFIISFGMLFLGTFLSTYEPVSRNVLGGTGVFEIIDVIGTRNGLFYGSFYVALGAYIKQRKNERKSTFYFLWFCLGLITLSVESIICIFAIHSPSTVLWLTCPIPVFALFMLAKKLKIEKNTIIIRKMSSFIYFSHCIWIHLLTIIGLKLGLSMFLIVAVISIVSSYVLIGLSKKIKWIKYTF